MAPTERFAAIDIGSNSIRCLIAERAEDGRLHVVDDLKDQPRLSRGLSATGRLSPEAMERAIESLGRMMQAAERRGAGRVALVATAAVRDAANGPEFADRVRRETGLPLEVIDGDTEARLAFLSVREHFALGRGRTVVADIGGGSLELVLAVGGLVEHVVSLPFGAVRMTEQYLADGRDAAGGVRRMRAAVRQRLRRALTVREWSGAKLFGSGGTFTNLARVAAVRERDALPPGGVHGSTVSLPVLQRILEWLGTLSVAERRSVGGLNPERADIIVAGLAVAAEVLERFDAPKITVSAFGLREGLLIHLARPPEGARPPSRVKALRRFADRCRTDRRHVEQVLRLVRHLFDRLGKRLGCAAEEWDLLEGAALLHDVGQLVSYRSHHKHSYHLIAHAESLPYSARERLLIAVISRYHRRRPPTKRHPEFAALEPAERATVRRLAALLRVADGLDRGHVAAVETMRLRVLPTRLTIEILPRLVSTDLKLELWGARRKTDLLARLLKREVVVRTAAIAAPQQAVPS